VLKEIIVQVSDDETEVAVLEDQQLVEIYIERSYRQRLAGNIYKGRVENVLPGMQAAFIDIGLDKNAFLYIEDALPAHGDDDEPRPDSRLSIRDVLKEGQDLIVQITKEPIGTKGARVTTHVTLPGRYLVLMPTVDYVGVSRRIEGEGERERLKGLAEQVKPPGMGLIVRTVSENVSTEELAQDVAGLGKLWKKIQNRAANGPAPSQIHKDLELMQRILRDVFTEDVGRLIVNTRSAYEKILELLETNSSLLRSKVRLEEDEDLFARYGINQETEKALRRKVWLKSGGYIVIDQTEALTAIDVNTGKYVGTTNLADTVLKTNLEAATEIARQLRLRNIGGIIIIDFIDMDSTDDQVLVLKALEEALRKDKTKANILGLTQLGLVEMTRKKVRQGLESVLQRPCPYCDGKGKVLTEETIAIRAQKEILDKAARTDAPAIVVEANPAVAATLIGSGGGKLRSLENKAGKQLVINGVEQMHLEEVNIYPLHDRQEIEALSVPVQVGEMLKVKIEEPHASNSYDGIARHHGFVLDVEGGGALVGETVPVKVVKVFRTFARARILDRPSLDG